MQQDWWAFQDYYLVGIKGVGMTALASCLVDLKKTVRGSDVAEDFVTKGVLARLGVRVNVGFEAASLAKASEVVIFSGANGGSANPQVQEARRRGLRVLSHARALGELANRQLPVAVAGVGGKSTIAAMVAFMGEQSKIELSYAVGVGEIMGLSVTGHYRDQSEYFVVEADEYTEDPGDKGRGLVPRFSFLRPQIVICPNLKFDHPDVYRDFAQTKEVFGQFFATLRVGGTLIYNGTDQELVGLAERLRNRRPDIKLVDFLTVSLAGLKLKIPGEFNQCNAQAALAAGGVMGWDERGMRNALNEYRSVKRRLEFMGERFGVACWDDYAHHPSEIKAAIAAVRERYPNRRLVVAFQGHTFSRTKQLLSEFGEALATNREVVLLEIFPSAREKFDPSISAQTLVDLMHRESPEVKVANVHTIKGLREYLRTKLQPGEVFLTLGAGDIYHVYD